MIRVFFFLFMGLWPWASGWAGDNLEAVFSYGEALQTQGDSGRAATEFGRYIHEGKGRPVLPHREEAYYRRAINLARSGESNRALEAFAELGEVYPQSSYVSMALLVMGEIYERAGMREEAGKRYRQLQGMQVSSRLLDASRLKLAWLALGEPVDVAGARAELLAVKSSQYQANAAAILHEMENLAHLRQKDPWVAGGLSLLVPGAGHLYLGRTRDGIFSFVSNALLIAGSVQSFRNGISGLGVTLGILELGWYTGTAFGAVSQAHHANRELRETWRMGIRSSVPFSEGME